MTQCKHSSALSRYC